MTDAQPGIVGTSMNRRILWLSAPGEAPRKVAGVSVWYASRPTFKHALTPRADDSDDGMGDRCASVRRTRYGSGLVRSDNAIVGDE